MEYYQAVIHKDKDSCFGVHFPDVPGCFSAGDTIEDAVKNASEALLLYFEDEEGSNVTPRTLDELIQDEDVKQEMAEGGILVAVPYVQLSGRSVRVNLSFDAGLLEAIDKEAKGRKLSRSAYLASAATAMMNAA
ncbi:type II toxin-antitoxin system HicB family antitoxin [Pseudovibrio sp. POLY-S9]|uniref:type II toxin-antitoxin system HicB family antitoxin n=1 Tax=Pseudovibrio sp. POLY-S9 TaxID=1576596 RepID=UPI00070D23AD|nr:type II toxin-antitoxin system HicB family antitoxin [Pseudovibrio sp. POLY-S9]